MSARMAAFRSDIALPRILPNIYRKQELRPWSLLGGKNYAGVSDDATRTGLIYELVRADAPQNPPSINSDQLMHRSLFDRYSSISVLIPCALLISLACAASKDARPTPTGDAVSPEGSSPTVSSTAATTTVASE